MGTDSDADGDGDEQDKVPKVNRGVNELVIYGHSKGSSQAES